MKLTRFERARIIGGRALQLSMGAPSLVKIPPDTRDPMLIALKELEDDVIPITVRRPAPPKKDAEG